MSNGGKITWWMIKYPPYKKNAQHRINPAYPGSVHCVNPPHPGVPQIKKICTAVFCTYTTHFVKYAHAVTICSTMLWTTGRYYVYLYTGSYCYDHRVWQGA